MTDVIAVAYVFRSAGSNQMPEPESDVMPVDSLSGSEAEPTSEKPVIESACNPVSEIPAEISAEPESESTQSVVEALEGMMFDPVRPLYRWAIKTNVAYLAATVANLGVEYSFGDHYSIDLPIIYSPYTVARDYRLAFSGCSARIPLLAESPDEGSFLRSASQHRRFQYRCGQQKSLPVARRLLRRGVELRLRAALRPPLGSGVHRRRGIRPYEIRYLL